MTDEMNLRCPQCDAVLALPAAAVGKKTQCPACSSILRIAAEGLAPVQSPPSATLSTELQGPVASVKSPGGDPAQSLPSGFTAETPTHSPEPQVGNPYAPSTQLEASLPAEASQAMRIETAVPDQYLHPAWNLFFLHAGLLIGVGAVVLAFDLMGRVAGQLAQFAAVFPDDPTWALVAAYGVSLLFGMINVYLNAGMTKVCLNVGRGRPTRFGDAFSLTPLILWRIFAGYFLLFMPLALPAAVIGLVAFLMAEHADLPGLAIIGVVALGVLVVVSMLVAIWLFTWPWYYVLIDRNLSTVAAIKQGYLVARVNKLNGFLLALINIGCGTVGLCMLYVGLAATKPLATLISAVAVLLMSGQRVSASIAASAARSPSTTALPPHPHAPMPDSQPNPFT